MTKVFSFFAVALLSVCSFAQEAQVSPSDVTATAAPATMAMPSEGMVVVEGMPMQSMDVSVVQGTMMAAQSTGCGCGGMYTAMPMAAPAAPCGCAAPVAQDCGCSAPVAAPVATCGTCCAAPVTNNCCQTRRVVLRRRGNDCCNSCGTYTAAPVAQDCGCSAPVATYAAPVSTGCCNSCQAAPACAPANNCCQPTRVRGLRSQPVLRGRIGGRRNCC